MLGYYLKNDLFKGKTIIELYRTVERKPFFERKKKFLDTRERGWLIYPQYNELELRPCNVPIQIVKAAKGVIRTEEELNILRRLIKSSINNICTYVKGTAVFTRDRYERIRSNHQLITDELIDSIIYCVSVCDDTVCIDHNLIWLFYGTTETGDYYVDAKELYQELPRKII